MITDKDREDLINDLRSHKDDKGLRMMNVYKDAVSHFGAEHQTLKACEELTELQQELLHAIDGRADNDKIREEMADVSIMLEQLKLIYGPIDSWIDTKTVRLEERMHGSKLDR